MYEAIFQAPSGPAGRATWVPDWKLIIDVVLSNLDRGQHLTLSCAYVFGSMVHAYETVGYPLDTWRPRPWPACRATWWSLAAARPRATASRKSTTRAAEDSE
jgi:hypothetical protein